MNLLYTIASELMNLSNTVQEGLEHMKLRFEEGQLRETLFLFEDVLEAVELIENSVSSLEQDKELWVMTGGLKGGLEMLARAYEENNVEKARNELGNNLLPAFKNWQAELEKSLKKYKDS